MAAAEEKKPGFFSRLFKKEDAGAAAPAASAVAKKGGPDSVKLQFPVTCASWSLDCKWVALGDIAGNIVLYTADILSRKIHMVPKQVVPSQFKAAGGLAANPVTCIAFSPNCLHVLSVSEGAPIQILNVMTGQQQFVEKKDRISSAAWSCDGEFLALGTREGTIDVHCVRNNYALQETIPAHIDGVHSLEFCPIGPKKFLLASGGMNPDDAVKVWDTHAFSSHGASQCVFAAKLSQFWKRDKAYVTVKWTCDSRFLLCGDFAGMVSVFDVHNRRYLGTLEGHCLRIRSISCSPDLRYAATSSEDQMIKIWEVATRKCVFTHLSQSNSVSVIWVPSMHCDASILVSEGEYLGILYPAFDPLGFESQPRQHEDLDINNALDHGYPKPKPRGNIQSNAQNGMYLESNFNQPLLQGDPQNYERGGRTSPSPQRAPQYSPPHQQPQPQPHRSSAVANDRKEFYDHKTSPRQEYPPEPAQPPQLQQQDSGSRKFSLSDSPIAQFPQFEHLVHLFKAKARELQQYEETVKKGREAFLQMHGGQFPQPVAPAPAPAPAPQQPNFLDPYDTSRPMAPPLNRDDSQLEGEGVSALSPSPQRVDDDDRPFFQLLNIQQAPAQAVSSPVRPAPADFIATPMQPAAAPVSHDDPGKSDVHKAMLMEIRSLEAKLTPMAKVLESQIRVATASARWKQRFWKESRVADVEKAAYYQEMLEELERNAQVVESYYAACQSVPHAFPQDSPVLAPRPNGIFDSVPQQQVDIINQMWHQSIEDHCARFLTAAKVNDQLVLDACITMGIEVNVREKSNGATALMFAAAMGYSGIVRSLLMAGAKINLQNSQGDSALILAAESAHADIVEILLDHGADMNVRNNKRMSALDASCSPSYANRGAGAPPPNPQNLEKIRHLLAKTAPAPMPSAAPAAPQPAAPQVDRNSPYVKYREQIESLKGMGFPNEDDCVAALVSYNGDFRKALNQLLSEPSRPASKPAAVSPRKPAPAQPQQQPQYPNNVYGAYPQQPQQHHHQQPRDDEAAKYSTQLTMLVDMGFTDMDANRVAIVAAKGDMGVAVQQLVNQPSRNNQPAAKPAYSQQPQAQPQKPAQQQYGGYPGFSQNQNQQYNQPSQPPPQPAGYPGFAQPQPANNANRGGYPGFSPAQQQPPQQPQPQPVQQQTYPLHGYQQQQPPQQQQAPYQSPYGQFPQPQPQQQPIPALQSFFAQPAAAQQRAPQPAPAQPNVQALYAAPPAPYAAQSPGQLLPYQQPAPISISVQPASPVFQRPPPFAPDSQSAPVSAPAAALPAAAPSVPVALPPSVSGGSPSPSQDSVYSSVPRSASRSNMDLLKQLSESPFTVTLTDHSTITDPQYYQSQWASLPMSHSVEWELKHKCQDDAVAASCKTDAIEQMLAKKYFFTMASGNVEGQLKFYLSAQAIKTPKEKPARSADEEAMSAFLAAAGAPAAEEKAPAGPETELVLIELMILLKTGRAHLQLRCGTAAGRDLMVPRLREALGGLLK